MSVHRSRLLSTLFRATTLLGATALLAIPLSGPAAAQMLRSPASSDPHAVQSGDYDLEPTHTQIIFSVSHMGFSTFYGQLSGGKGTLSLDDAAPAKSSFEIHVPVKSLSTSSGKLTSELKSNAWLDASANPEIVFKSTAIVPTGPDTADVTGALTLHGVTRPVTLHAKLVGSGINPLDKKYTVGFDLIGSIRRSDFGVRTYVPLIGDNVGLTISGAFEKQG